ncbi:MAG TPA: hypothetical protein VKA31_06930 [Mariprofundaceae bacterium]|nr:hypothetical protein [Mariprofundaceae bacterium]
MITNEDWIIRLPKSIDWAKSNRRQAEVEGRTEDVSYWDLAIQSLENALESVKENIYSR